MKAHNFFGLSAESMVLVQAALDETPPMTDEQAWEIGRLFGWIPVDKETRQPLPNPRGIRVRPVVPDESPGISGTTGSAEAEAPQ